MDLKKTIIIMLIMLPVAYADYNKFTDSTKIVYEMNLTLDVTAERLSELSEYSRLLVNVSLIPRDEEYQKSKMKLSNIAQIINPEQASAVHIDEAPNDNTNLYALYEVIRTDDFKKIDSEVKYPLAIQKNNYSEYLKPINEDSFGDYKELFDEITKGTNDLFLAVAYVSDYISSKMEYDTTIALDSQSKHKPTEITEVMKGACSDYSILMSHILRSAEIPTRFVYGIVLNPEYDDKTIKHIWIEVFFPGYGWIPVDPTYNQVGEIDLSHIKLKDYADVRDPLVNYYYVGNYIELKRSAPMISTEVTWIESKPEKRISIDAGVLQQEIPSGSYDLVMAEIVNLKDHYAAADIFIQKSNDYQSTGKNPQRVILKPFEKRYITWIIKTSELKKGHYGYYVYSHKNTTGLFEFEIKDTAAPAVNYIMTSKELYEKTGSISSLSDIGIKTECRTDKTETYANDILTVECVIENKGSSKKVEICYYDNCIHETLRENNITYLTMPVELPSEKRAAENGITLRISHEELTDLIPIDIMVLEMPEVDIRLSDYPAEIRLGEVKNISFDINAESEVYGLDISILDNDREILKYDYGKLSGSTGLRLPLDSRELAKGSNTITLRLTYMDKSFNKFTRTKDFNVFMDIEGNTLRYWQYRLNNMIEEDIFIYLLITVGFFIAILAFIFNPGSLSPKIKAKKNSRIVYEFPDLFEKIKHDEEVIRNLEKKIDSLKREKDNIESKEKMLEKKEKELEEFIIKNVIRK